MRRLILAAGAVLLSAAQAQAPTLPLRIAEVGPAAGPCAPLPANAPAGQKAYYQLLAERLQTEVLNCPVTDAGAAALALAAGQVDMARLDGAAYGAVSDKTRSVLTTRSRGALNRLPVVVSTLKSSKAESLANLAGASLVFGGPMQATHQVPKAALRSYGADDGFFGAQRVAQDYEAAAAQLRNGEAQAMVLHAGAWQKLCRGDQPGEDLCADLKVLWRQRQVADQAWAVRLDMTDDRRFRLIGIHVAMHNEAAEAFAWAAGPDAEEFEPTEAKALIHQGPTVGS